MSAYLSRYHVGLNGKGYIISQRNGVRQYQKKRAPSFVNKFGGGDSSYRDATFWQYFVQTNWRNGAKQLKWDDAGKFWKSSDVDTTILEELSLSKSFSSAGQMIASGKVNAMEAWRSSSSWWNANYGYRQQLTITNNASATAPVGYPIKVNIDTAVLESGAKVRSDRKDWRIIYDNGSTLTDLTRDYVSTTSTFFALQASLAAGASTSSYYVYYGYSSESTTKQASSTAEWNAVYGMYGTTPDANSIAVYHYREGSGTTLNDESGNSNTGTGNNTPIWDTDGRLGRDNDTQGAGKGFVVSHSSSLNLGSLTVEGWFKLTGAGEFIVGKYASWELSNKNSTGKFRAYINTGAGLVIETPASYNDGNFHHAAMTYDGSSTLKIFVDGTEVVSSSSGGAVTANTHKVFLGIGSADGENASNSGPNVKMQHVRISNIARTSFPYALTTDPSVSAGSETTTQPPSSSFDLYGGGSDGKVYKWDGTTTWTEQFDTKRIVWYDTGEDGTAPIGNAGAGEDKRAQTFTVPASVTVSAVAVKLVVNTAIQGITARIETTSGGVPTGSLVDANATGTISNGQVPNSDWVTITFSSTFTLASGTTYALVLQSSNYGSETGFVNWLTDTSAPSYSGGSFIYKTGAGSWTADTNKDFMFRVLGNNTSINCMKVTSVGGTQKLYVGTGSSTGQANGDARLYSFDGTTWALAKAFATATESMILAIEEYTVNSKVYVGLGPQAKIYESSDMSTFTLSKDINIPQNPGYPYTMKEYNRVLHVGGGSPEFLPTQFYNGFLNVYDTTAWNILYPFDFTVIKSLEFYDAYLFMGTYRGDLYVYDTASLNPLFNFKDQYNYSVEIPAMKYYNDKLYIGLYPQSGSNETNVGIWLFDRRGLSLAHTISGVTGYRCFTVVNGLLMVGTGDDGYVYKIDLNTYATTGYYQSSYFDANLPSIDKLYNQVTIRHDPLAEGQSIVVYYKFKEADDWTLLGTSNTVGDIEKNLSFDTGIHSKKISLKVVLNTTNTSASPKLTETVMQYSLYPTRKWQWTLRLKAKKNLRLLDNTFESRTATEVRTDLEDLLSSQQLYLYTDVDGITYTVLTNDIDGSSWVVNQLNGDVNEDEVVLSLLEA